MAGKNYQLGQHSLPRIVSQRSNFVFLIGAVQVVFLLTTVLLTLGARIPLLTPLVAITQTALIPGVLICSLLLVDRNVDIASFIVCAVGVSLVVSMVAGTTATVVYPPLGIDHPITPVPLAGTILTVNAALIALVATMDRTPQYNLIRRVNVVLRDPVYIALILLPFAAIFGAYLLSNYGSNALILLVYALVAILPLVAVYRLPNRYYPFLIWIIALSLLLGNNLSYNFFGSAIEYRDVLPVYQQGIWTPDMNLDRTVNLRMHILHPMHALLSGIQLHMSWKVIHPLVLSPIPVVFYVAFRDHFDAKTALLSASFYMFMHMFYTVIVESSRNGAVLFIGLFVLLLLSRDFSKLSRRVLFLLYAVGLIFTHYGTAHFFLLIAGSILVGRYVTRGVDAVQQYESNSNTLSPYIFVFSIVLIIVWDIYVTDSRFVGVTMSGYSLFNSIFGLQFVSEETDAAVHLFSERSLATTAVRHMYIVISGIIAVGGLRRAVQFLTDRYGNADYIAACACCGVFLALSLSPAFLSYDVRRLYIIAMVFLAPFFVLGIQTVFLGIRRIVPIDFLSKPEIPTVGAFLAIFLLLSSGVVSAVATHDRSTNVIVDKPRIIENGEVNELYSLLSRELTDYRYTSSWWLATHINSNSGQADGDTYPSIYKTGPDTMFALEAPSRQRAASRLDAAKGTYQLKRVPPTVVSGANPWRKGDYIYVSEYTVLSERVILSQDFDYDAGVVRRPIADQRVLRVSEKHRIYDNGRSKVYRIT